VTGSDRNVYPPMSTQLEALGIDLIEGYSPDQVALAPDVFVIGNVMSRGNPLVEAILDSGRRYESGPEWLARNVLADRWVMGVAGTHGKTTTTSMIAAILTQARLDPTYVVGGRLKVEGSGAKLGSSRYLVAEADESDGSFLKLFPTIAVVTNIENDHLEFYGRMKNLVQAFRQFADKVPFYGALILNSDCPNIKKIMPLIR
jgi:UDP-N-acetylmuramate: L-alanyl-gamma-D-glutamyl-meso-diaminopimelate ligase